MYSEAETIQRETTPRGEILLRRRDTDYEIISNGTFLMATYNGDSERLLVESALEAAPHPQKVLIGGLGVGFSLAAALADERTRNVTVLEIEQQVIRWNHTYLAPFSHNGLADPRTHVIHADLLDWVHHTEEQFDAICLDIDNGPDWTVTKDNQSLYSEAGLTWLSHIMAKDGVISFWSASPAPAFVERLRKMFSFERAIPIAHDTGEPDYVYLARLA